ncbi:transglycosylase domain-containing protein [Solirubrobacter soli]|uniref:transglycosylase domain-containing protein n=1 Tax=Solirubrobacter soli TaxID=363832 RepID=UPI000480DD1F|nr:transglycosylase domain-containing protein [Solirubrobacter soli]
MRRRQQGAHYGRWILLGVFIVLLAGAGAAGAAVTWVLRTANSAPALSTFVPKNPGSLSEVFASDGKTRLGYIQSDDLVQPVAADQFPTVLKQATVAIEDERFYKHKGVDYEGIIRAAVKNATEHKTVQGGSTLTMQLVKILYTQDDTRGGLKGYQRKIKEARLARDLEAAHKDPKNWVLGKYLNNVPYGTVGGQSAIGAGAAARLYFNKRVQDLTLREAAMLAGMPQAPSQYSPVLNASGTKKRRNEVLGKMAELGYISRATAQKEMKKGLGLHMERYFQKARERYVLDFVQSELIKEYGRKNVQRGGYKVYTTIDLNKQKEARAAIADKLANVGPSSAIVSIDPATGNIVAMASSAQYGKSKFNLAAQGHRQPGSSFKTMVLLTALREGVNPSSTSYVSRGTMELDDPPCGSPASPWKVKTYSGSGRGSINLVSATLASDNSVYAQLTSDLGPDKVKETARMMGIKSKLNGFCAESLGGLENGVSPLEMASAYATIANGGYRNRPRIIKKVVVKGKTQKLPKRWRIHRVKAFSDGVTYEATKILQQNIQGGTGTHANIGCPAGGKTGTTDKNIDAWFVGFTPRLSTAVWVGFPGSAAISMNGMYAPTGGNIDGGTYPADIWGEYMKKAVGKYCGDFKKPTEPFTSSPFDGHYARMGGKDDEKKDENGKPVDPNAPDTQTKPGADTQDPANGGDQKKPTTDNNGNFDPNAYETPPQADPGGGTQAPTDG